ncbi:MAG: ATP-dependent DNA helicase [Alphaproteobacteria bacterium]
MSFDIFEENADMGFEKKLQSFHILIYGQSKNFWLSDEGELFELSPTQVKSRLSQGYSPIILDKKQLHHQLQIKSSNCLDILELFAFTYPAQFIVPLYQSLAKFLLFKEPCSQEEAAITLLDATKKMLNSLKMRESEERYRLNNICSFMEKGGWNWAAYVQASLHIEPSALSQYSESLKIWNMRKEWEDSPPIAPPLNYPLEQVEVLARLKKLLGDTAEERVAQKEYAVKSSFALQPQQIQGEANIILAEAGTGTGKTLGYIAPASLWAEKNEGTVWISTYTKNLQRQLNEELNRLYPNPLEKRRHVVVRKGRENYFCLLNYEDILSAELQRQRNQENQLYHSNNAIGLGLVARWLEHTQDGDMIGGDFPAWLIPLLGKRTTLDLSDTRGECIYSSCPHWKKCFIEHVVRRSQQANIVISNHALSLIRSAQLYHREEANLPSRYIFDEGHHLFDVADQVFSSHLTGVEAAEIRRWILGNENRGRSRFKGLRARIDELIATSDEALEALVHLEQAAKQLPAEGWRNRIFESVPNGKIERFLAFVRKQVLTRNPPNGYYDIETQCKPLIDGFLEIIQSALLGVNDLFEPAKILIKCLEKQLDEQAETLDSTQRGRIEAAISSLNWRVLEVVASWMNMLQDLMVENELADGKVSWFGIERRGGVEFDMGMYMHYLDPTEYLSDIVLKMSQGVLITSATLRDNANLVHDDAASWNTALKRMGGQWLNHQPQMLSVPSPFDFKKQSRLFVITDVDKNNPAQLMAAFRELFISSGGGGLGLFTAINRLNMVYNGLKETLMAQNIPLYAQHMQDIDIGTLIDMFRQDIHSCLLGTDAVRDGIDVPGESLRLIVFDRVPWPRRTILHTIRKKAFGGRTYEETLVIAKLRQAWGRMIRKTTDKGVFVMLDKAMPSRFQTAFPEDVIIERIGLAEATKEIRQFLGTKEETSL